MKSDDKYHEELIAAVKKRNEVIEQCRRERLDVEEQYKLDRHKIRTKVNKAWKDFEEQKTKLEDELRERIREANESKGSSGKPEGNNSGSWGGRKGQNNVDEDAPLFD